MYEFGHKRPIRDANGEIVGLKEGPAQRITKNPGPDGKKLIVSLENGDLITIREQHGRKVWSIAANDLYWHLLRIEARNIALEKARAKKAVKQVKKLAAKLKRDEKRLLKSIWLITFISTIPVFMAVVLSIPVLKQKRRLRNGATGAMLAPLK
jgi:hypothetical protein